ncbi:putative uncharacterized protein [Waddlia chondrophila 2032/99]|uniref:Uncharacterized protein n=2 Tax=Waddlia chondrophila TaxID=71667 RepID=D6YWA8_WADCW|nr:hypothetical protein [Waddlia chondrophila]ADI38419.1 hypothetical protein wcw_1060 [Waddlia chondrophila WSU 86-1044]CCB91504.1 putative uncharacterized protein [Waddlia chondrophila 2032/99]
MSINVSEIAHTIETFAKNIDNAKDAIQTGGLVAAMPFASAIQSTFSKITALGKLENVTIPPEAKGELRSAIEHFQKSARAAEQAAPQAVALLGAEAVNRVKDNLQYVLDHLDEERGGKVKGTELSGGA